MNKWIKVKDKVPKDGQKVIYYFEYTGISVGRYEKIKGKDAKYGTNCFYSKRGFLTDDVTHWMTYNIFTWVLLWFYVKLGKLYKIKNTDKDKDRLLELFVKAAKAQKFYIDMGINMHVLVCNFQIPYKDQTFCNCGIADLQYAYDEYKKFNEK